MPSQLCSASSGSLGRRLKKRRAGRFLKPAVDVRRDKAAQAGLLPFSCFLQAPRPLMSETLGKSAWLWRRELRDDGSWQRVWVVLETDRSLTIFLTEVTASPYI